MLYQSQPGPMSHDVGIFYLIHLISFVQLCVVSQLAPLTIHLSFQACLIHTLTHSNSFTSHPSLRPLSKSWVRRPVSWRSSPTSFPSTPTLLFPSSIHPSPQWRGGMQGCIPGLMKLILQESRPKWSLNQHHKNKRLLVQVVSHTRLPRHFNVFVQRRTGTQGNRKFRTLLSG